MNLNRYATYCAIFSAAAATVAAVEVDFEACLIHTMLLSCIPYCSDNAVPVGRPDTPITNSTAARAVVDCTTQRSVVPRLNHKVQLFLLHPLLLYLMSLLS